MGKENGTYKLKGFTIVEVIVTLALTSLAVTFSYASLSYTQKLFYNYKAQNKFINQYTDFKRRMDFEALRADLVSEETENEFNILRDSITTSLQILEHVILLKRNEHCDTFNVEAKNIKKEYVVMKNPLWTDKLLSSLQFEVEFTKQKFNFCFYKDYDTSFKLKLEQQE